MNTFIDDKFSVMSKKTTLQPLRIGFVLYPNSDSSHVTAPHELFYYFIIIIIVIIIIIGVQISVPTAVACLP